MDILATSDGYFVGYTYASEYMRYNVDVITAGKRNTTCFSIFLATRFTFGLPRNRSHVPRIVGAVSRGEEVIDIRRAP